MPIKNHMQSDALLDATQNLDSHCPHIPVMEMLQSSGLPQALAGTDNIKEIEGIRLRGDASSHALLKVFLKVWANQHGYGSAEVRRVVEMIKHGEKYLTGQLNIATPLNALFVHWIHQQLDTRFSKTWTKGEERDEVTGYLTHRSIPICVFILHQLQGFTFTSDVTSWLRSLNKYQVSDQCLEKAFAQTTQVTQTEPLIRQSVFEKILGFNSTTWEKGMLMVDEAIRQDWSFDAIRKTIQQAIKHSRENDEQYVINTLQLMTVYHLKTYDAIFALWVNQQLANRFSPNKIKEENQDKIARYLMHRRIPTGSLILTQFQGFTNSADIVKWLAFLDTYQISDQYLEEIFAHSPHVDQATPLIQQTLLETVWGKLSVWKPVQPLINKAIEQGWSFDAIWRLLKRASLYTKDASLDADLTDTLRLITEYKLLESSSSLKERHSIEERYTVGAIIEQYPPDAWWFECGKVAIVNICQETAAPPAKIN